MITAEEARKRVKTKYEQEVISEIDDLCYSVVHFS